MNSKIISNGILRAIAIIVLISALAMGIYQLKILLIYIAISGVIALISRPSVRLFKKKLKFSNTLATTFVMLIIIFILGGIISLFIPLLISQGKNLASINFEALNENIQKISNNIFDYFGMENSLSEHSIFNKLFDVQSITSIINAIISVLGDLGIGVFSVIFIAFFFIKDGTNISNNFINLIDDKYKEKTRNAINIVKNLLSRYFIGLLLQVSVIFIILTIVLLIFGIKDAVVIAFLCALLNLIPYLGPVVGLFVISILTISNFIDADFFSVILPKTIYVLCGFLIAQLVDNFFSQPYIFSNSVKSSPLEIFLIIVIGGILFGVLGMVIAVPTYTVLKVVLKAFFPENKIVKLLTKDL